jgi:GNAT superfamily N-acetyltransferase
MTPDIRLLHKDDLYSVKDLAKLIWDGDDYLGRVAKAWIEDGGFLGMFDAGKLIGCAKITRLPDQVIWLEGLRIHPDYQHQGLGRQLSGQVLDMAQQFIQTGDAQSIEFSTYHLNEESIHLAETAGFKQIDEYYILTHRSVKPNPAHQHGRIHDDVTDYFPKSIPFGWKFLHPAKQSVNWLNKKADLLRAGGGYFYVGGDTPVLCMLSPVGDWLEQAMPAVQHVLGKKEPIEVLLHNSRKFEIPALQALGFHWWEEDHEDRVLVYRYFPS